jgi:hypothetical protein
VFGLGRLGTLGRRGSFGFNPAVLFSGGTAGAWYDPSDLSSMSQDTAGATPAALNQPVGRILDKSGNGLHLTQATAGARPTLRQDGSNRYYLEFDAIDDRLTSASVASGNFQTLLLAAIVTTNGMLLNATVGANDRITVRPATTGTPTTTSFYNGAATGKSGAGAATAQLINGTVNKTGPVITTRLNGVDQVGTTAVTPTATVGTSLGASTSGTLFFGGACYGALQIARALTAEERAALETFMGAKIGLVL